VPSYGGEGHAGQVMDLIKNVLTDPDPDGVTGEIAAKETSGIPSRRARTSPPRAPCRDEETGFPEAFPSCFPYIGRHRALRRPKRL
jgi:hypothetical protein